MNNIENIDGEGKKVFKYDSRSNWVQIEFKQLKKADKFRLYNSSGKPILIKNQEIYVAHSDAYQTKGKWTMEVSILNPNLEAEIKTSKRFSDKEG